MQKLLTVISWKYNPSSRHLKIVYSNGHTELYHPVPEFIYDNLLRREDKAAFVHKYLEYNLHFSLYGLKLMRFTISDHQQTRTDRYSADDKTLILLNQMNKLFHFCCM